MKKELLSKTLSLKNSIAPQYFSVQEESIYYFHRVNTEEGRFWFIKEGHQGILFETDGGQGIFDEKGNMYILSAGGKTTLTPIENGRLQMPIELEGMFYDFKISQGGSYVFLGNKEGNTVIQIKNSMRGDSGEIPVTKLIFASCLALDKENIYLGGLEKAGELAIVSMNYLGCIKDSWLLECSSRERLIGKLQIYGNKLLMLIGGAYDTIGILDLESREFKEIRMEAMHLKGCTDFQIFKDEVYLMDGKTLVSLELNTLEGLAKTPGYGFSLKNRDSISYEYLMYTRSMRNLAVLSILPAVIASSLITIMLLITGQIYFKSYAGQAIFQLLLAVIGDYLIASLRNVAALSDKASRIDNLLSLYNERGSFGAYYTFPILASSTIFAFVYLIGYPGMGSMYAWIAGALAMIMFSSLQITCIRKLRLEKDDVIVELLWDDDIETEMEIRAALRSMKNQGCEEMLISIATPDEGIIHWIDKWVCSRKSIIGEMEAVNRKDDGITSITLDFSKRDIRYSRFSIAMDYISYLRKGVEIRDMHIQCCPTLRKNRID